MHTTKWLGRGVCLLAVATASGQAQSVAARVTTKADQDLLTALVAAEDSRDTTLAPDSPRRVGLKSTNSFIRAFTVRGLGRLERSSVMPAIVAAIDDSEPDVRAAAADAVAQSAVRGGSPDARAAIVHRLAVERNIAVRAALLEALGRLVQGSAEQVKVTASTIAPSLTSSAPDERRGAIRGIFFLSRKPEARAAGVIPKEITDRIYAMLTESSAAAGTPEDRVNLAAILGNASALSDDRIVKLSGHADPYVRDKAVAGLQRVVDTTLVRSVVGRGIRDTAPIVRFRAVGIFARRLRASDGCAWLTQATHDRDVTVALAATDALAGCRADSAATASYLDSVAFRFRDVDAWHLTTHAFVSLAALDAVRARALMPKFERAGNFFVRMYADSAARLLRDTAALYRLARDAHPNVASGAINGLSALVGHAADSVYIAALKSDDNQLLMSAAAGLKGSKTSDAITAVNDALMRLGTSRRQTVKDGLDAVRARLRDMGRVVDDLAPRSYIKSPIPTFADLATIEQTEATIEMADGAIIKFRFHPFDAPTNAARFVRLAQAHAFDGLTFHRVAPFFVVQGPSPNANEYSAPDAPFTRDELGAPNMRGTIGLSTRGRDTGDGQIYVNTVDNTWLDHEYTVMGTITTGLAAFDTMQEGAKIRRITVSH